MKKLFFVLLLPFVFACNKTTVEDVHVAKDSTASNKYAADSTAKWTKNVLPNFFPIVKKDYKDGKLSQEDC